MSRIGQSSQDALFVDTGPWTALMDPRDQWRDRALQAMEVLKTDRRVLVTTNLVLMEAYTGLVGRIAHAAIARLRTMVMESRLIRVKRVDELIEELAWKKFIRHDDKTWSFVDCTSFIVMEQLGLTTAFSFDHHFRQAGFQIFPTAD